MIVFSELVHRRRQMRNFYDEFILPNLAVYRIKLFLRFPEAKTNHLRDYCHHSGEINQVSGRRRILIFYPLSEPDDYRGNHHWKCHVQLLKLKLMKKINSLLCPHQREWAQIAPKYVVCWKAQLRQTRICDTKSPSKLESPVLSCHWQPQIECALMCHWDTIIQWVGKRSVWQ